MWKRSSNKFGKTPVPETPYLKAKQVVDNRLGSAHVRAKNWRLAFFGQTGLCALLAGGFIWQGAQATIIPYVIEVNEAGGVKAVGPIQPNFEPSDAQIAHQLAAFIKNVRSVSIDPVVLRENWLEAYSFATDQAAVTLNTYAKANDPFTNVGQRSVTVDVLSVVRSFRASLERDVVSGRSANRHGNFHGQPVRDYPACNGRTNTAPQSTGPLCARPKLVKRPQFNRSEIMRKLHRIQCISVLALTVGLSGCASLQGMFDDVKSGFKNSTTTLASEMDRSVYIFDEPQENDGLPQPTIIDAPSLIMPGQMKLKPVSFASEYVYSGQPRMSGFQAVSYANRTALVKPETGNYLNAIQVYPYTPGSLYQVYTAPDQVTDIALERGERLTSVSAGDTHRWTVGDTVSGAGANEQVNILVRPMAANLSTNAVITTTRRTYYLELKSFASTYMAAVSWRYPHDAIKNILTPTANKTMVRQSKAKTADIIPKAENMRFNYDIIGDSPNWRPIRVFDDGKKVFIQFPKTVSVSEAPPLFVTDKKGKQSKLVNYRVRGEYYIVDRLFDAAELRLGEKDQIIVRIVHKS